MEKVKGEIKRLPRSMDYVSNFLNNEKTVKRICRFSFVFINNLALHGNSWACSVVTGKDIRKRKIIMKYVKYVEKLRVLMIPIVYFQKKALKIRHKIKTNF